jgi:hypothetical protein
MRVGVAAIERRIRNGGLSRDEVAGLEAIAHDLSRPTSVRHDSIIENVAAFNPRGSMQTWEEMLAVSVADGTQVLNSTAEAIMTPDFTLPANYLYQGKVLKYTLHFTVSTVITTPGTITFRLRYGGVAGTTLATSGAYAPDPTAALTTRTGTLEWWTVCRGVGTAGATMTIGRLMMSNWDDASVTTLQGNLNMMGIPQTAAAAVNVNTTTANAYTPTVQFSVATATTQLTTLIALLEALT